MPYTCPICFYDNLPRPPVAFTICPSCGTEFGYEDATRSHADLRQQWVVRGLHWFSQGTPHPDNWNPWVQLMAGGYADVAAGMEQKLFNDAKSILVVTEVGTQAGARELFNSAQFDVGHVLSETNGNAAAEARPELVWAF
jgi:hypothetical protein